MAIAMRKLARWLVFVSLGAGCTLAGLIVWARWGPTLNPPAVDPGIRLNRDHAHVDPACAKHYGEAFAALTKPPEAARTDDGLWRTERPIAAEIVAWVEQNNECLRHIRAASTYSRCWFTLKRRTEGALLFPELSQLRLLARLLDYRARIAADRGDLETFIESIRLMDQIARHLADHPLTIWQIVARAVMMETQRLVLEPFAWPALRSAERAPTASAYRPPFCLRRPNAKQCATRLRIQCGRCIKSYRGTRESSIPSGACTTNTITLSSHSFNWPTGPSRHR